MNLAANEDRIDLITLNKPDDWHLHLRDGSNMEAVLPSSVKQFRRGLVMPNLSPSITNWRMAKAYRERILAANKTGIKFDPLMTIYLTDITSLIDIRLAKKSGVVVAAKLYPINATTGSENGVTNIKGLDKVFREMEDVGLPLCIHGETLISQKFGDKSREGRVGYLRREAVFLKETMIWIVETFPDLKIILEHITTKEAVEFIKSTSSNVAATITPHHLLATHDDLVDSHHNKCLPILKEEEHRQALLDAATSGNSKFFAGTDSAPHSISKKETACGCAGCFNAETAIELYAEAFDQRNAIAKLPDFMSLFGAKFYGFEVNSEKITLVRSDSGCVPKKLNFGVDDFVVPFRAGLPLKWSIQN